ncbi:hypothetical protein CEP52_017438 [Fusarium oligoseptatum]|uniref:C2H2-type domain-containing protein n=1 Tax=Fusarium oligoseptatum TaxID=2604345 RepID=A0A428RR78_9HYPO|nr:hypothetical protein CEP52_017438 [Fusarium oligoseptatum]
MSEIQEYSYISHSLRPRYNSGPDQPLLAKDICINQVHTNHGPLASSYNSMDSSHREHRSCKIRNMHSAICGQDGGYGTYASADRLRDSTTTAEFGLYHRHFQFQSPADVHGDSLKKKLGPTQLSVQLPNRTHGVLGSRAGLTRTPTHNTMPPRSTSFHCRDSSPNGSSDTGRSPETRLKRNSDGDAVCRQSSYGMKRLDGQSLKRLRIDDAYMPDGQKRRVASQNSPSDYRLVTLASLSHQRDLSSSGSSTRLITLARGNATPSVSMSRPNWANSCPSTIFMPTVSIANANSYGYRPALGLPPGGLCPISWNSSHKDHVSLNPSPRVSMLSRGSVHSVMVTGARTRNMAKAWMCGGPEMQVIFIFMCKCCPKPKRFETIEELNVHEAEDKYECSFCGKRYQNKNEAKRHRNSLHVRPHSWSCSALSRYDLAFHDSTSRPGEADTCGYCGCEFPRSGRAPRHGADQALEERVKHLQEVHKFGKCNSSKKFYRADHFRQHLKYSHSSTNGKWTRMLENVCMVTEDSTANDA